MRRMTAKYRGRCIRCDGPVVIGADIEWLGRGTVRHHLCPVPVGSESAPHPLQLLEAQQEAFISFVAELLMESNNSYDEAWSNYAMLNECWDGEPEITAAARRQFDWAVPLARMQNQLLRAANG